MLQIKHFVYNAFMENTYVLYDETKNCVIIDPGCYRKKTTLAKTRAYMYNYSTPIAI